jgi:hypothetical protein
VQQPVRGGTLYRSVTVSLTNWLDHEFTGSNTPSNNKMQRTSHGSNGGSPLILVLDGLR